MSVHQFGFIFRLIGIFIMLFGIKKLIQYNKAFYFAYRACTLMLLTSLALTVSGVYDILYELLIVNTRFLADDTKDLISGIDMVNELLFHGGLAWGIRAIAKETEEEKIAFAAVRNFVFLCVYYLLYGIALLPFDFIEDYVRYFSMPVVLLYFACIILNLILIFRCYMRICDEADVDMARKPSRFAFINKLREESDRREQRAIERTREYNERKKKKDRRK